MDGHEAYDEEGSWNQYDAYTRGRNRRQMIHMTQQMTTKIPPAFDGKTSFFAFEDAIDDWRDITDIEEEKRGPALRNKLEGEDAAYKRILDREMLRIAENGLANGSSPTHM